MKTRTGMDSQSVGLSVIEQAVWRRMSSLQIDNYQGYYDRLIGSNEEFQALVDEAMVPETWFFRDKTPFQFLQEYVAREWMLRKQPSALRVLALPCSSGEEPLSVAIALHECGLNSTQFSIDGIDISKKSLDKAQRGIYTRNSFRGTTESFRSNYFDKVGKSYQIHSNMQDLVHFEHGNLFELNAGERPKYDFIFCRNLLIYFDRITQQTALRILHSLLGKRGILFVGHAEAGCLIGQGFEAIGAPNVFAFTKAVKKAGGIDQKSYTAPTAVNKNPPRREKTISVKREQGFKDVEFMPRLKDIQRLADEGRLDEAAGQCEAYLSDNIYSAEAYFLMAVIEDARGNQDEARELYKKVVYLEPDHYQALLSLAFHSERMGDSNMADLYRMRSEKIAAKK